jgi:hypothetical protein
VSAFSPFFIQVRISCLENLSAFRAAHPLTIEPDNLRWRNRVAARRADRVQCGENFRSIGLGFITNSNRPLLDLLIAAATSANASTPGQALGQHALEETWNC